MKARLGRAGLGEPGSTLGVILFQKSTQRSGAGQLQRESGVAGEGWLGNRMEEWILGG